MGLGEYGLVLWMGVVYVACVAVAAVVSDRNKKRLQAIRDREGLADSTYLLFLRPFFSDTALLQPNPFYSAWSQGVTVDGPGLRPGELVGSIVEPLIAVREAAGSHAVVGNARLSFATDEWQVEIRKQIDAAAVILLRPLLRRAKRTGTVQGQATVWEIGYLVESGRMERTLVMMPMAPLLTGRRMREMWEHARERAVDAGLELPAYDPAGGVFAFAPAEGVWRVARRFQPGSSRKTRFGAALLAGVHAMATRHGVRLRTAPREPRDAPAPQP